MWTATGKPEDTCSVLSLVILLLLCENEKGETKSQGDCPLSGIRGAGGMIWFQQVCRFLHVS
jgi:hypothetical protein